MFSSGSTKEVCMYYLIKARQRVERFTLCPSTFLLPVLSHEKVLTSSQSSLTLTLYCMIFYNAVIPNSSIYLVKLGNRVEVCLLKS